MKRAVLLLAALVAASPAEACRKHSIWNYPWPERCPTRVAIISSPSHEAAKVIEPDERQLAIEKLRDELTALDRLRTQLAGKQQVAAAIRAQQ